MQESRRLACGYVKLNKLAEDNDAYVRKAVARNKMAPPKLLVKLSKDDNWIVRENVAQNSRTPVDVLMNLKHDDQRVASVASRVLSKIYRFSGRGN